MYKINLKSGNQELISDTIAKDLLEGIKQSIEKPEKDKPSAPCYLVTTDTMINTREVASITKVL